jgi:hypothetical protein
LFPIAFGVLGDWFGVHWATFATAIAALATYPLAFALTPYLARAEEGTRKNAKS